MGKNIRVLVAENEGLYREMLTLALGTVPGVEVVSSVADGVAALAAAQTLAPDVVVLDIALGSGPDGIEIGRQIRRQRPGTGIVFLSNYVCRQVLQVVAADEAAGWAYLQKRSVSDLNTLVRAVQGAAAGLMVLDPQISRSLSARAGTPLGRLTQRQFDVLRLVAQGYNNAAIGRELLLSAKSVENYLTSVYQELGIQQEGEDIHPRIKAVLVYLEGTRLTPPPERNGNGRGQRQ